MIEQPPLPDTPTSPDIVKIPDEVNGPIPPGKPAGESPDLHPAPPPTDPAPPVI